MSEQETYEALKEILPELQSKLRQNIEHQYQEELQKMQTYYRRYAEDMVAKRQNEIRMENEVNEAHLRKQLSLIQRQRQQWLTLEQSYRRTILELSEKLKDSKNNSDISALTEIVAQNNFTQPDKPEMEVMSWKKKSKIQTSSQLKNMRKDTERSQLGNSNVNSINNMFKQVCNTENQTDEIIEDRPLKEPDSSQKKKWKIGDKSMAGSQTEERAKRQDTLVLSPPKMEDQRKMKSSLLLPPNQSMPSSKSSIFWNEQGKKKFLSMIRSIK